jgi:NADPH:quinone reductase-like Zn-dependent oxidoreductase
MRRRTPRIEAAGTVVETGDAVENVRQGDHLPLPR